MSYDFRANNVSMATEYECVVPDVVHVLSDVRIVYRAGAPDGNRQVKIEAGPSSKAIIELANALKAFQIKLVADYYTFAGETLTATNVANATSLSTAITLANDIKTKHNAILTALNSSNGVTLTNYNTVATISAANATNRATLAALLNETRSDMRRLVGMLDVDPDINTFTTYNTTRKGWAHSFLDQRLPYLLPTGQSYQNSNNITATQERFCDFHLGANATVTGKGWLIQMAQPLMVYPRMSLWVSGGAGAGSTDTADIRFLSQILFFGFTPYEGVDF